MFDLAASVAAAADRPRTAGRSLGCLLAACAAVAMSVGCDDVGNAKSYALQAEAAAYRTGGTVGDAPEKLDKLLGEVNNADNATPLNAQGQHAYGQYLLAKADGQALQLAGARREAERLLIQIDGVVHTLALRGSAINAGLALEPAERLAATSQFIASAKGGSEPTFAILSNPASDKPSPTLSTLAAAQQEKSRLDGEIAKADEQIATLSKQRDEALTQAGQVSAAMESQNSADRVESAKKIAGHRTQAAQLSRQIADVQNNRMRLAADLGQQTTLIEQLTAGLEATEGARKAIETGWTQLSGTLQEQTAAAKGMIEGAAGGDNLSVKSLADALAAKLSEVNKLSGEVDAAYTAAIAQLAKAQQTTTAVNSELSSARSAAGQSVESGAWSQTMEALDINRIALDSGVAKQTQADTLAGQVRLLTHLLLTSRNVDAVVSKLQTQAPAPFDTATLTTALTDTLTKADAAYSAAKETLDGVSLTGEHVQALRPTLATVQITNGYNHAMLCRLAEVGGAGGDLPAKAKQHLDDAKAAANAAVNEQNLTLPLLPAEVTVAKKAPESETPAEETSAEEAPAETGETPAVGE